MDGRLDEKDWLYTLSRIKGVGRKTLRLIYERCGSFSCLAHMNPEDVAKRAGLSRDQAQAVKERANLAAVREDKRRRLQANVNLLSFLDESFPSILYEIPDPPLLLFYKGDLSLLQKPMIGVVGTRTPTPYGRSACQMLSSDLSKAGCVIVSGLATGIDAEAHIASLQAGGGTIAVLGCGIDTVYPPQHRQLYRQIAASGLLLSEYPPGTKPHRGLFPERNRLISGLSLGIVVVEAAERSGSLITADFALDQGRDVFAVPGPIFAKTSVGVNNLIKQGAKLVTGYMDILEEYAGVFPFSIQQSQPDRVRLEPEERRLFSLVGYQPVHWEELYQRLDDQGRRVLDRDLVRLQAKGLLLGLPGGYYVRMREAGHEQRFDK